MRFTTAMNGHPISRYAFLDARHAVPRISAAKFAIPLEYEKGSQPRQTLGKIEMMQLATG